MSERAGVTTFAVGLFLALLGLSFLGGCSPSQLALQADAAAVVGGTLAAVDRGIVDARDADLEALVEAARAECPAEGCDDARGDEILAAYDARLGLWSPLRACVEPAVQAFQGWLDAIWLASVAASSELGWQHVVGEAARLGLTWRGMRACIERSAARLGHPLELPDLPAFVYPFLESAAP